MAGPALIFKELHRLRRHAKELQAEIERGPRMLKAQQTKLAHRQETIKQAQDHIKHLKVMALEKEGEFKAKLQQVAKYEKQINTVATKKEMDALQAEIATARTAHRRLEDEIFAAMTATEEKSAELPALEKGVQQAKQELAQFERDFQSRQTSLNEQLCQAQQSITEVETTLGADVKTHYDRQIASRGEDALSSVTGRTCTACYTEITQQSHHELVIQQMVVCKSCGRMLYLAD